MADGSHYASFVPLLRSSSSGTFSRRQLLNLW